MAIKNTINVITQSQSESKVGNVEIKSGSIGSADGDAQTGSISGVEVEIASGVGMRWFALAIIVIAVVAAMAWGTNGFEFHGAGIDADSKPRQP